MRDTPKTDAQELVDRDANGGIVHMVDADFARGLERELSALRIASQALLDHYLELVNSGDAGTWDPETEEPVIRLRRALQ